MEVKSFSWDKCYTSYVNLDSRPDRDLRMTQELVRVGIKAHRTRGFYPNEYMGNIEKVKTMMNRTPGALGCHMSQASIIQTAKLLDRDVTVFEDDLIFCTDIKERLQHVEVFLNKNQWDVFFWGGTYHIEPVWHKKDHPNPEIQGKCDCNLGVDWELTSDTRIVRTYGIWSTYAYSINKNSIEKILTLLNDNLSLSIGIDHLFIMLQPRLKCFAFNPGMVKQIDNQSDIGEGITHFSGFAKLGPHWWADKL